jgi:RNA polymerase sigma-70 factor, ECF subfamily
VLPRGEETPRLSAPQQKVEVPPFEIVYERYFDFVWSMVRRFGIGREVTKDVVQEVFVVVHSKLHTLERPESLRSWLYSIVRRTASDHRRKRSEQPADSEMATELLADTRSRSPADLAEQNAEVRRLWALLDQLDPIKREVFIMAELEQFTCPEIAEALGIPVNTVYSRLRAAREAFEAAMVRESARARGKS